MRYFPGTLDRSDSESLLAKIEAHFEEHSFGFWALEKRSDGAFVGFTGLAKVPFEAPFTPAVEIGWRVAFEQQGQGFATEAASAAVAFGFEHLQLGEIVSFTVLNNFPSRRVMEKLGMTAGEHENFAHPRLSPDHPLSLHVLYRLERIDWRARGKAV